MVQRVEGLARRPRSAPAQDVPEEETRSRAQKTAQEDQTSFVALSAIFREQPATIDVAIRKIRAQSPGWEVFVDALGSASSRPSQAALVSLMKTATLDPQVRSRATSALARTSRPEASTVAAFKAILLEDTFNRKALYGLGTFSRRAREAGDEQESRDIGEYIVEHLKITTGPSSLATVLRAIANSGYAPALTPVLAYVTDTREEIRAVAVRALQSMPEPKVDDILASRLLTDESTTVRVAVIEAAAVRAPSDVVTRALVEAALTAADPQVRYHSLDLMIRWLPRRPDLRASIERVALDDTEDQIRVRAQAAL
jgi:hypothetical protein